MYVQLFNIRNHAFLDDISRYGCFELYPMVEIACELKNEYNIDQVTSSCAVWVNLKVSFHAEPVGDIYIRKVDGIIASTLSCEVYHVPAAIYI